MDMLEWEDDLEKIMMLKKPNRKPDFILGVAEIYIEERVEAIPLGYGKYNLIKLKLNSKQDRMWWYDVGYDGTYRDWHEYDQADVVNGILEMCIFEGQDE